MTEDKINRLRNLNWLKNPGQTTFHVYPDIVEGSMPFCGDKNTITKEKMELPGDRSISCIKCFNAIFEISLGKS